MILKKLKLENIRSYLNQEIEFPLGSVLLSGDIGSGKSTILLAIDFSLFGLTRGNLSGSSLLRNGKNKGSVELEFEIDNKNIIIKRTLKREVDSVAQDSGYIIVNGKKKEASPVELKQLILDLLNYPSELLTKSKGLIYRYTVYTPQEEMKQILSEDKESRLNTLRRVFGIDKYKKVKENSQLFITHLKEKRKEFTGRIEDLENKKKEKQEKEKQIKEIKEEIEKILPELNNFKEKVVENKNKLKEFEDKINKSKELKKELELQDLHLQNRIEQKNKNNEDLEILDTEIKELNLEIKENHKLKVKKEDLKEKQTKIDSLANELKELNEKIQEFKVKSQQSSEIKSKISKVEICPLCKQKLTKEHINEVLSLENKKIKELSENLKLSQKEEEKVSNQINKFRLELDKIREDLHKLDIFKIKIDSLKEKTKMKQKLLALQNEIKENIGKINSKKSELFSQLEKFKDVEKEYEKIKLNLEDLQEKEKLIEIKKVGFDKGLESSNEILDKLNKEIEEKLRIKENIQHLAKIQHWFEEHLINLISSMEKKVMLRVHSDFSSLFENWFSMLVEGEILKMKLDEEFTPLIEQNGHEIDYNYLSGGEKTAAALAYRLALNQVINTLMSVIKTRDLLILDEPTDGFSTDQLDRIKDVLDELSTKQIIIVSHEPKIESFVDNIIRIEKKEHVSEIII